MKAYVSDSDAHVVQPVIGEGGGNGKSQRAVNDSQRVKVPKAAKEFAEQNPSAERQQRQQRAWNVHDCEKGSRGQNRSSRANQRLQPYEEDALQDEFLREGPDNVLP